MTVVRTIAQVHAAVANARANATRRTVGFVPTMGALHEGHLALIRRARDGCDVVVASLFVNPRQFNDPRDLAAYPRQEEQDAELAQSAADVLFVPPAEEIYPDGRAGHRSTSAAPPWDSKAIAGRATSMASRPCV